MKRKMNLTRRLALQSLFGVGPAGLSPLTLGLTPAIAKENESGDSKSTSTSGADDKGSNATPESDDNSIENLEAETQDNDKDDGSAATTAAATTAPIKKRKRKQK